MTYAWNYYKYTEIYKEKVFLKVVLWSNVQIRLREDDRVLK